MESIINMLPDIIIYIVLGYLFCITYTFTRKQDTNSNYQYLFLKSITWGFVLKKIYDEFPSTGKYTIDIIGMAIASALLGGLIAMVIGSWVFEKFLNFLHVGRNPNKYIWNDLIHDKYAISVRVEDETTHRIYEGDLVSVEELTEKPQILLSAYKEFKNGVLIHNYSENYEQTVLIDTSKFSVIKLIYAKEGHKVKEWARG